MTILSVALGMLGLLVVVRSIVATVFGVVRIVDTVTSWDGSSSQPAR